MRFFQPPFRPVEVFLIWFEEYKNKGGEQSWKRAKGLSSQLWQKSVDSTVRGELKCQLHLYVQAYHYGDIFCCSQSMLLFEDWMWNCSCLHISSFYTLKHRHILKPNGVVKIPSCWVMQVYVMNYSLMPKVSSLTKFKLQHKNCICDCLTQRVTYFPALIPNFRADSDVTTESHPIRKESLA